MPAKRRLPPPSPDLADELIIGTAASTADDRFSSDMRRRLSPAAVSAILTGANSGDPRDIADLHNAMLRTWPRLVKNIGTLRRAAASAPWTVNPWTDDQGNVPPEAADRAATVRTVMTGMQPVPGTLEMAWRGLVAAMAENQVRGTGVAEMLWHTRDDGSGSIHAVRACRLTHPNYYRWPMTGTVRDAGGRPSEDRLMFQPGGIRGGGDLRDWPEHQFIVQLAASWNDHPAMAGLLSVLSTWWIASNYGPQWMVDFAQQFGIPFMWAEYPQGDTRARDVVYGMLRNLSGKRYGAFPQGTMLHLIESGKSAGDLPQKALIELADEVADILILGQTLTTSTQGEGSRALGEVHAGVAADILRGHLDDVSECLNSQMVTAILRLNYGDTRFAPSFHHGLAEPEDETAKATRDTTLLTAGVTMPRAWLYKRHGIPIPADGEATISTVPAAPTVPGARLSARVSAAAAAPFPDDSESMALLTDVFTRTIERAAAEGSNAIDTKES